MSVSVLAFELSMTAPVLVSLGSAVYKVRSHSILPPKARFWRAVVALQHVDDRFGVGGHFGRSLSIGITPGGARMKL
ncbi:hypothetical protein DFP72DRAFT_927702, partial [Ephemerocybe angulata]